MDTEKKVELEKRMVAGLGVLFVITLCTGPLKSVVLVHHDTPARNTPVMTASPPTHLLETGPQQDETLQGLWPTPTPPAERVADAPGPAAYTAHDLRDPLKSLLPEVPSSPPVRHEPPSATQTLTHAALPTLHLQGLLWGGPEPKAIIDDDVYGLGDTVQGATIKAIDRQGVTLEAAGMTYTLRTKEPGSGLMSQAVERR